MCQKDAFELPKIGSKKCFLASEKWRRVTNNGTVFTVRSGSLINKRKKWPWTACRRVDMSSVLVSTYEE